MERLHIKNFALIDDLVIEFGRGLNVITGETGAGKSIVIGALSMLLGDRTRTDVIRAGNTAAEIEGRFRLPSSLASVCSSRGVELDGETLVLKREMSAHGRSKAFANDQPISIAVLKRAGDVLVDLHGQHHHQSLLNTETHLDLLDQFGGLFGDRERLSELYEAYRNTLKRLNEVKAQEAAAREKEELYRFQLKEIDEITPLAGEEEELERERSILENSERLHEAATDLFEQLHQSDGSVIDRLSLVRHALESMSRIDTRLTERLRSFDDALEVLRELSDFLLAYRGQIEFDADRLETIRDRLGAFSRLRRKYGGSIEQVLDYRRSIGEAVAALNGYDHRLEAYESELVERKNRLTEACLGLSQARKRAAHSLKRLVEGELADLNMSRTRFDVCFAWVEDESGIVEVDKERYWVDRRGMDRVEFFIAPNVGEELKPLAGIASGGEVSRIMLALKSILARLGGVPTMVFDEVDIGIGGRVAEAVGEKLKRLAKTHQIICITHLPQIASLSEQHYTAVKKVHRGRTISTITHLDKNEKVEEVARLLGGKTITPIVRKHAREMVERQTGRQ